MKAAQQRPHRRHVMHTSDTYADHNDYEAQQRMGEGAE